MDIDQDDLRHRQEEAARKAKRKEKRENKSAAQLEKERRRKEHQQRTLKEVNKGKHPSTSGGSTKPKPPPPTTSHSSASSSSTLNESKFQSLFTTRSQGFLIELAFRNAPPRPPVGPCFVGLGLDGELNDQMIKYKSNNAVEANFSWKLHAEPDLGVPLAPSAMDYEGCYVDPSKMNKKQRKNDDDGYDDDLFDEEEKEDGRDDNESALNLIPLHPDDEDLLNWKGHFGDSAAEELQQLRDKARAEARLGVKGMKLGGSRTNGTSSFLLTKQDTHLAKRNKDFKSRVLDEVNPFFMKKTTYLANDHNQRVHDFKSLAQTKAEKEEEIEKKLSTKNVLDKNVIEQTFVSVHQKVSSTTTGKRKHPSKENVEAEYEIPLLPDDETWGYSFIHVVLDNLPKDESILTDRKLERAYIGDVNKGENSQRMECNLLVGVDDDIDEAEYQNYNIVQKYDLDVIPLKEEDKPHNNFLFILDEEMGVATYHPISSRVQLSSGRPSDEIGSRKITKRPLNNDEVVEMEERMVTVDADMADKYSKDEDEEEEKITHQSKNLYPFGGGDDSSSEED